MIIDPLKQEENVMKNKEIALAVDESLCETLGWTSVFPIAECLYEPESREPNVLEGYHEYLVYAKFEDSDTDGLFQQMYPYTWTDDQGEVFFGWISQAFDSPIDNFERPVITNSNYVALKWFPLGTTRKTIPAPKVEIKKGQEWVSKKHDTVYTIVETANMNATKPGFVPTIVYASNILPSAVWSLPEVEFRERMNHRPVTAKAREPVSVSELRGGVWKVRYSCRYILLDALVKNGLAENSDRTFLALMHHGFAKMQYGDIWSSFSNTNSQEIKSLPELEVIDGKFYYVNQ